MDDLELHRHCLAEPRSRDPAFRAALASRPDARRAAARAVQLDAQISRCAQAVEVPEGLAERVLLRRALRPRRPRWRPWALAAGLLLTLGIAPRLLVPDRTGIEAQVIDHIRSEAHHLGEAPQAVSSERLNALLATFGGQLVGYPGALRFAAICPTRTGIGLHLILDGERGPVTVLYLPGEPLAEPRRIAGGGLRGGAWQLPGGSLAIVGVPGEQIGPIRARLDRSIRWTG